MLATLRWLEDGDREEGEYEREIAILSFPERKVYLAGGTSWGDDPNEGYRAMDRFIMSGVADVIGFE